jgi:signal transduction histidine kinase
MNMSETTHPDLAPWFPAIMAFVENSMALAIGVFNAQGQLRYGNAGMQHLLGTKDSALARECFKAPTFETLSAKEVTQAAIYQGWLTFGSESTPHRSVRGAVFRREETFLIVAEHDIEESERVNHQIMAVNREITNLQRELARQKAELAALNERKNEFMGIAAHDLRSPLAVIQGYSSLLTRYPDMPADERNELLTIITDSIQDMLEMLNNLLNVSEIESGKLRLAPIDVDIYDYMDRIAQRNRHLADQKNIALCLELEPNLPSVQFDPHRIQQVMDNLLSNAFKFSHRGTQVTIHVVKSSPESVEISVIDQGQGIKPDELGKVFLAFQRTSTRSTAGEHSTGLGLAICKRIVEVSGGQIDVESTYGQGSRFFFTLPTTP